MTKSKKTLQKNLQQLERHFSGEILPSEKLPLLPREKDLARIPLNELEVGDLRFLINQGLGWKFLIPQAIEILQKNPLAGGDYYDGELLSSLLSVKRSFWQQNPRLYLSVENILQRVENIKNEAAETLLAISLPQKIYDFRKNNPLTDD